ncbi:hypothetical protein F5876DRAFT_84882 [Lentinula aff. lateritia]|uniref:Uncharacterized protein n=1 Tax=Lentinula aff. lateritia TaxID=2804960 RepID=A0ACC1TFY8_9AGAR|nr:hypothetical protein F5876DRAFT_84882 [Lentinula aff. lateritia]
MVMLTRGRLATQHDSPILQALAQQTGKQPQCCPPSQSPCDLPPHFDLEAGGHDEENPPVDPELSADIDNPENQDPDDDSGDLPRGGPGGPSGPAVTSPNLLSLEPPDATLRPPQTATRNSIPLLGTSRRHLKTSSNCHLKLNTSTAAYHLTDPGARPRLHQSILMYSRSSPLSAHFTQCFPDSFILSI